MSDNKSSDAQIRRRWINLGEFVAVAGLVISGLALWNSWASDQAEDKSTVVAIEKERSIPLALRGRVQDDGKALLLSPVEGSHSLDSATLSANGRSVDIGSDGLVSARELQTLVGERPKNQRSGAIAVDVTARYVEIGKDRRGGGRYRIRYRWDGGGLFGRDEIRLTGWSRG
jgi:hypothetical protein